MPRRAKTKAFNDLYWIPSGRACQGWSGPGVLVGRPVEGFVQFYSQDLAIYFLEGSSIDYLAYGKLYDVFKKMRSSKIAAGPLTVQALDPLSGSRARTMEFVEFLRNSLNSFRTPVFV